MTATLSPPPSLGAPARKKPDALRPRVALITEGSYPLTYGGVSTWCDQVVRHLGEFDFHIVTIAGRRGNPIRWTFPENVSVFSEIGFWEPGAPGEPARYLRAMGRRRQDIAANRSVYQLLRLLTQQDLDMEAFDPLFDLLLKEAREHRIAPALRSRWAVGILHSMWLENGVAASMNDVLVALDVLEHLLRTVSFPLPEADIYHAAGNGLAGLVAIGAAAGRAPFVLSEHGVYLRERYLEYLTSGLSHAARDLLLRFFRFLTIAIYRRATIVLPVSRYNRRWELQSGVEPDRITVIHNGVDPDRFRTATKSGERRPPTIGFVGRIDRIKDPLTLIRSASVIQAEIPDVRVRMWGSTAEGHDDYAAECHSLVQMLGLEGVVSFEGHTDDPLAAYRASDVVAMTSISEGLPYGVLEAMMSGVPVISTDVGGIHEALDGVGVLVPPRDHLAVASACIALLRDPARRAHLAQSARERAMREFNLDKMVDRYRSAYQSVLPVIDLRSTSPSWGAPVWVP